jgi:hypothetical protein
VEVVFPVAVTVIDESALKGECGGKPAKAVILRPDGGSESRHSGAASRWKKSYVRRARRRFSSKLPAATISGSAATIGAFAFKGSQHLANVASLMWARTPPNSPNFLASRRIWGKGRNWGFLMEFGGGESALMPEGRPVTIMNDTADKWVLVDGTGSCSARHSVRN